MRRLTVDQVALLLECLSLGDYVAPFRATGVDGDTLHFCHTREELKEEKGVDMTSVRFRKLRAAVEEFAPSGVPTSLLDEAQGRVQQREQEAADAALAHRLHQEQQRREAAARRKAEAPKKVIANRLCRHHHHYHHQRLGQNLTISHYFCHQCVSD